MLVQKICKYCKGIIENAKPNQFYHKKEDNVECWTNRRRELSQKSSASYRKRWRYDPNIGKELGSGWLSQNPHKLEETNQIDFELEYDAIQKEKRRLRV